MNKKNTTNLNSASSSFFVTTLFLCVEGKKLALDKKQEEVRKLGMQKDKRRTQDQNPDLKPLSSFDQTKGRFVVFGKTAAGKCARHLAISSFVNETKCETDQLDQKELRRIMEQQIRQSKNQEPIKVVL